MPVSIKAARSLPIFWTSNPRLKVLPTCISPSADNWSSFKLIPTESMADTTQLERKKSASRNSATPFVANKGRVLSCYRDRSQLRSFKMDAVMPLFKDRALRKRLLPEFDGKSTCDIFCNWPRKRWPTYLYIDS